MLNRRKFIESCLSALMGVSLASPSQAWTLIDPALRLNESSGEALPTIIEKSSCADSNVKVIGVGGGGGNAARYMFDSGVSDMKYIFVNTDKDALNSCAMHKTIQLHRKTLSARTKLGRCRETAVLSTNDIRLALDGTNLLFVIVGMGGGTGTEAAPVIGRISKEMGIKTVALVTMPFSWEGPRRMLYAETGLAELQSHVDTVIVLPNDKLLEVLGEDATMNDAFDHANEVMKNVVVDITEITMAEPCSVLNYRHRSLA